MAKLATKQSATQQGTSKNSSVKQALDQMDRVAGRSGSDTIRLWEGYKEQAILWRALALIQVPSTSLAICAALVMYFYADTIIEVPPMPQPGHYSASQLPDSEFINVASEVVNSIASYQPATARPQFSAVRRFLWEPALSIFEDQMMNSELRTIEETGRSQLYFVNQGQIAVERAPELEKVLVRLPGTRMKLIGDKPLPADQLVYYVTMTTVPRNSQNEYGIVVVEIQLRRVGFKTLAREDAEAVRQEIEAAQAATRK